MFLFMYSEISALLMFLIWEQNDLEFGENDLFVQCIMSIIKFDDKDTANESEFLGFRCDKMHQNCFGLNR